MTAGVVGGSGHHGGSRFGGDEGRRGRPLALPLRASDVLVECEWEGEEFGRGPLGWVSATELTPDLCERRRDDWRRLELFGPRHNREADEGRDEPARPAGEPTG